MFEQMKQWFFQKDRIVSDNRWIFGSMLVGAGLSLLASLVLSVEAIELAKNADAVLPCSINAVLNCATVALHPSAQLLGFPNSFIGLITSAVLVTIAVSGLWGVKFPRLFMFLAQVGFTVGLAFGFFLFYISFVIIQVLCPWCLVVFGSTIVSWFAITRYNIREKNLYLPASVSKKLQEWTERSYDKVLMWSALALVVIMIIAKYGESLFS